MRLEKKHVLVCEHGQLEMKCDCAATIVEAVEEKDEIENEEGTVTRTDYCSTCVQNCAHLERTSAKSPWVEQFLTGTAYYRPSGDIAGEYPERESAKELRCSEGGQVSAVIRAVAALLDASYRIDDEQRIDMWRQMACEAREEHDKMREEISQLKTVRDLRAAAHLQEIERHIKARDHLDEARAEVARLRDPLSETRINKAERQLQQVMADILAKDS